MKFSERLKTQRNKLNLTQKEVANELYVTQQTISSWENGRSYPDLETLIKLSDLYQISLDVLVKENVQLQADIKKIQVLKEIRPVIWILMLINLTLIVINLGFLKDQKVSLTELGLILIMALNSFTLVYLNNFVQLKLLDRPRKNFRSYVWWLLLGLWLLAVIWSILMPSFLNGFFLGFLAILTFWLLLSL
ncbi:helix-turn-helix domain-containing protein [Xylocopilactobacillus apicola]|uniref:HTH cro/C1-type domain-containing protein n=1 Tax=Xylocopilactobacillus apicola TaxID=2932184 RepID=A0AAU9D6W1_9LACO|nr:helix-turn-helix transcriptional regulator [Xylocopilactobacillus apicola]BDR58106.1 hypothetical protein XA3_05470 [Xylocopilactobacillus apicola]